MAVTIPSDLVLDVMRNATPLRTGRVAGIEIPAVETGGSPKPFFSGVLNGLSRVKEPGDELIGGVLEAVDGGIATSAINRLQALGEDFHAANTATADAKHASPQVAFEQMVIRSMFETMLPAANSGIYGQEGSSSGVWRSLFADSLATAYVDSGGLGIAVSLAKHPGADGPVSRHQWPYFEQQSLNGITG